MCEAKGILPVRAQATHLGFGKFSLFGPPALEINCATVIPLYSWYTTALQALWALFISSTNPWLGINFLFSRSVINFKFSSLGRTFSETFFPVNLLKWKLSKKKTVQLTFYLLVSIMYLHLPFPAAEFEFEHIWHNQCWNGNTKFQGGATALTV